MLSRGLDKQRQHAVSSKVHSTSVLTQASRVAECLKLNTSPSQDDHSHNLNDHFRIDLPNEPAFADSYLGASSPAYALEAASTALLFLDDEKFR
jgi:hypothetical protein